MAPLPPVSSEAGNTTASKTPPSRSILAPLQQRQAVAVVDSAELTLWEKFVRHAQTSSTLMSVLLHGFLLLILSLIVITGPSASQMLKTVLIEGNEETQSLEMFPEAVLDLSAGESSKSLESIPDILTEPIQADESLLVKDLNQEMASLFKDGFGKTEGKGGDDRGFGGFTIPKSGGVVTKGSFTAWTEPQDPKPNEDYSIVILIRLPERVNKYRVSDLSGQVIGTDRYRQSIPGAEMLRTTTYLPVQQGMAQIVVKVPGAARLVKDTIRLKSKLLNEEQDLEIEF